MSEGDPSLRERVRAPLVDEAAIERVLVGATRVRQRRARRRTGAALTAAAGALLAFAALRGRGPSAGASRGGVARIDGGSLAIRSDTVAQSVALSDGSTLLARAGSRLTVRANDGARVDWELERGAVRFSVRPRGPRRWTIDAGLARISVIGTQFDLERAPHALDVRCTEGTVRVDSPLLPERARLLHAGDHLRLTDAVDADSPPRAPTDAQPDAQPALARDASIEASVWGTEAPARPARPTLPRAEATAWRALAQHGEYDRAYELLGHEGVARETRASSPEDLLALADVARLSGHPSDAVAPLEALLSQHGLDGSAPLAAYTLGRVLLTLSRASDAARAFDRALSLGAPRAIEEDARLQLVRARAAAGDRAGAQRAADDFRARYGESRSAQSLQRWLGPTP